MPIAIRNDKINLSSEKKTEELANKFFKKLKPGNIVFLYGEMGVGKTTFIKYLINNFQRENNLEISDVTSPTFTLMNQYQINQTKINHYDLFRLKSVKDLKNLGLFEENQNVITFVEWPQIIQKKPQNLIELNFEYEEDFNKRSVKIKGLNF